MRIGVVADDLTGAGDIGVMFAKHGYAVRVFGATADAAWIAQRLAATRTDVAILDTDSRFDPPELAAEKVRRATRLLTAWGAERFYNKTCSVFRGNIGAEFDAMLDELDEPFACAVAAFPRNGRVTRGGIHYVHGVLLAESEFARDPVHPRTESDLVRDLASQTRRPVTLVPLEIVRGPDLAAHLVQLRASTGGYALCDVETQADLAAIARATANDRVLLGSSALAEELPRMWPTPPHFDAAALTPDVALSPSRAVLVVAGSVMPQTRAQVSALEAAGISIIELATADLLADAAAAARRAGDRAAAELAADRSVVVRSQNSPDDVTRAHELARAAGIEPKALSKIVSAALAEAAAHALATSGAQRLITLGGDTSASVCARLGIDETVVLDELEAGLPVSLAVGPPARLVVLKSGSFGGADFGLRAIERLRR